MRLAVGVAVGLVLLSQAPTAGAVPDEQERTPAVAWGDRYHRQQESLAAWLEARGVDYRDWADRHPAAAAALEHGTVARDRPADATPTPASSGRAVVVALATIGTAAILLASLLALPAVAFRPGLRRTVALRGEIGVFGLVLVTAAALAYVLAGMRS